MEKNIHGFAALPVILIAAVMALIAGGAYFFANKTIKPKPAPVADQKTTSDQPSQEKAQNAAIGAETKSPAQILTAKAKYNCDNGKIVYAWFYRGEQIPAEPGQPPVPNGSAKINLEGRNFDLPQTISADGGRYANSDESFVFWSKGDGALVLENGSGKNYTGCVIDATDPKSSKTQEAAVSGGIIPGIEFKGDFDKNGGYSYRIDKNAEISFVPRKNLESRWAGDAILKKNSENYVLLENVPISGPGDGMVVVWTTNDPNILLLRHSDGDLGWWAAQDYYLDLAKRKIVFSLNYGSDSYLTAKKDELAAVELDLKVLDNCGKNGERAGKKAQIADLTFNGKAANILNKPIEVDCLDTDMFGPHYSPEFDLVHRKIENDFSKFRFALVGQTWKDGAATEIWSREFYVPFNDPKNIKIYQESL
ncbi:MAG: MliC family protein [Candidatus Paceibacterota bacterium]